HLGLAARDARALSALYPGGFTDWLAHDELALGSIALAVGFDARVGGLPLAVGVGLGQTALRFGERVAVDERGAALGSYEPVDRYRALALGAATTGAVRVGVGATVRHVTSTDRVLVASDGVRTEDIWGLTFDLGLLAEADVARLLGRPRLPLGAPVQPALPLPRTARLGWSALGGLDLTTAAGPLRLVEGAFAVQAEHSLVRAGDQPGEFRYEGFLGDLDPFRHGVLGEGNDVVTGRHGWR